MLDDLRDREAQLARYVDEYKASKDYESAMKCDIRLRTIRSVIGRTEQCIA